MLAYTTGLGGGGGRIMSQQLGNEVEMQGRRAALGYDTLQSRRALYQLSYQGNSAGRGSNLLHNTRQTSNHSAIHMW